MTTAIRVLMADDHPIVRAALKVLIAADPRIEIVGEASDGLSAILLAAHVRPDVAVVDLSMPGRNGAQVAEALRISCPDCRVLIFTSHSDRAYVVELLEAGVAGYMLKQSAAEELVDAICVVAAGGTFLDPAIAGAAVGGVLHPMIEPPPRRSDLGAREIEVPRLRPAGLSQGEILSEVALC